MVASSNSTLWETLFPDLCHGSCLAFAEGEENFDDFDDDDFDDDFDEEFDEDFDDDFEDDFDEEDDKAGEDSDGPAFDDDEIDEDE
jgi:hypothetical protein